MGAVFAFVLLFVLFFVAFPVFVLCLFTVYKLTGGGLSFRAWYKAMVF